MCILIFVGVGFKAIELYTVFTETLFIHMDLWFDEGRRFLYSLHLFLLAIRWCKWVSRSMMPLETIFLLKKLHFVHCIRWQIYLNFIISTCFHSSLCGSFGFNPFNITTISISSLLLRKKLRSDDAAIQRFLTLTEDINSVVSSMMKANCFKKNRKEKYFIDEWTFHLNYHLILI